MDGKALYKTKWVGVSEDGFNVVDLQFFIRHTARLDGHNPALSVDFAHISPRKCNQFMFRKLQIGLPYPSFQLFEQWTALLCKVVGDAATRDAAADDDDLSPLQDRALPSRLR